MYLEDDLLQLSALQHFLFCPRQCALIHIEQVWIENSFIAEGRVMHKSVDKQKQKLQGGIKIERGLLLCSSHLGLSGKADIVEFHKRGNEWIPYPIEYKRGKPKKELSDKV